MPVYLDEEMCGRATDIIGFPHLLVCNGVVAITATEMFGVHSSQIDGFAKLYAGFWTFCTTRGCGSADVLAVVSAGNWLERYKLSTDRKASWIAEMTEFATVIGYHGKVYGFDTSIIDPKDGTYVEYERKSGPAYKCAIRYKRNEKTVAVGSNTVSLSPTADIAWFSLGTNSFRANAYAKGGVVGKTSILHTGKFHEVDYGTRLVDFDV